MRQGPPTGATFQRARRSGKEEGGRGFRTRTRTSCIRVEAEPVHAYIHEVDAPIFVYVSSDRPAHRRDGIRNGGEPVIHRTSHVPGARAVDSLLPPLGTATRLGGVHVVLSSPLLFSICSVRNLRLTNVYLCMHWNGRILNRSSWRPPARPTMPTRPGLDTCPGPISVAPTRLS